MKQLKAVSSLLMATTLFSASAQPVKDRDSLLQPKLTVAAETVAGFDLASTAYVKYEIGNIVYIIPRRLIAVNFASQPLHKPPTIYTPELAVIYPGLEPIPVDQASEYRTLNPAATKNFILVWINGIDEKERVEDFFRINEGRKAISVAYGLLTNDRLPNGTFFSSAGRPNQLIVACSNYKGTMIGSYGNINQLCTVNKYMFGNHTIVYRFDQKLLPVWSDIDVSISNMLTSFVEEQ